MKILILAPFTSEALSRLRRHADVIYESWLETHRLWDPEELAQRINEENISILVVEADFVLEELLENALTLKLVGICRGAPHNVEVAAATRRGIPVIYTPGRNVGAVAEMVVGLMICLARHIIPAHNLVASGNWQDPVSPYINLRGRELKGKTAGIIGLGAIGSGVARKLRALGMKLLGHDPYAPEDRFQRLKVRHAGLEELLTSSDFVTLHCPVRPETKGLLNRERLGLMKPNSFLINTAGAELIDEAALAEALAQGKLAGAACDIFPTHPIAPDHPLLGLPNVILTPHLGGATEETVERHSRMMSADIERFLRGKRPRHLLNPEVWRE